MDTLKQNNHDIMLYYYYSKKPSRTNYSPAASTMAKTAAVEF